MNWYCDHAPGHPIHGPYHDHEYGFPVSDETALFERLGLEIFQAGLSWLMVLNKREALNRAFAGFQVDEIARYGDDDVARLLADATIIRNKAKIRAIIANAGRFREIRAEAGSFAEWLAAHHPRREEDWVKLFRANFRFAGPEVVREFLMSIGYLPGAHSRDCPVFSRIALHRPPWAEVPGAEAVAPQQR
ncbi:MAG: DNA-3-methyladenine glycosylase I [Rhodospirillales bacterium]|nr:DNA-3-methyladenine glycosylase I [Rhodospirillales bacterium]